MRLLTTLLFCLVFSFSISYAEYSRTELFVVPWGDGVSAFKAKQGKMIDPGTPENTLDDYYDSGDGPSKAFVDIHNNILIVSRWYEQIKEFNSSGELIYDFSEMPDFKEGNFRQGIANVFIDDKKNIYMFVDGLSYIPKINYETSVIDSLIPYEGQRDVRIYSVSWTYYGKLMILDRNHGWVTFDGKYFVPGGDSQVYGLDGKYHSVVMREPGNVKFFSFDFSDEWGTVSFADSININIDAVNIKRTSLLNSFDSDYWYVQVTIYGNNLIQEVWKFDLSYNFIDKIALGAEPYYCAYWPKPFITADGTIYEFYPLDDGLHVSKWVEE